MILRATGTGAGAGTCTGAHVQEEEMVSECCSCYDWRQECHKSGLDYLISGSIVRFTLKALPA